MDRGMIAADRDWLALYQLATAHLVAPVLYATLATRDRLSQVPPDVRTALEGLYQLNDQRNRRLRAVLRDTVRLLNQAGIEPILLKGAIALLPEQYPLACARVLGDLDLAVDADQLAPAVAALQGAATFRRRISIWDSGLHMSIITGSRCYTPPATAMSNSIMTCSVIAA
jgi:hypothetical protein